ncbi:MAG TPA: hypothetical protein VGQ83_19955 [Polyangia bacterium]|jgi:hypothetical protein
MPKPLTLALLRAAALLALCGLVIGACSDTPPTAEPAPETLGVTCEGKCDGWGSIQSLWADAKKLDLGDLLNVSAGLATDQLDDALAVSDYGAISFGAPKLYALHERAAADLTLGDIDSLVTGLAARFGERELTTEVNSVRRAWLQGSSDAVYGECAFHLRGSLGHNWNVGTGGFGAAATTLGFAAGTDLEARVIGAFGSELSATGGAPLGALKSARGFVLPRSPNDLGRMKPGESFALRGSGNLGLNLGVGVPILIAQPASVITYSLVVSAGLRTQLSGAMDVQLVRLAGDQVVVDVGVDSARVVAASVALEDGWGVQGLLKTRVSLGGIDLDLGKLVEKALQKQMNAKLSLIAARAEATKQATRLSVARLRFNLGAAAAGTPAAKALAQALRGDVRLAQALANRGEPGVVAEFDLARSGVAATSHAGVDIFGMSFFKDEADSSGSVVVQTPGGARTVLFDSLHRGGGWFFSSHSYTRVGLAGLIFDARTTAAPRGEANLFLQVEEGDDYMEREKLLDHLDGVIAAVGGQAALSAVEGPGNELMRYVVRTCPSTQAFDPCRLSVLNDPQVVALRADGHTALAAAVAGLEPSAQALVLAAGDLRLTAQATREPAASLVGPPSAIVLDFRLDDAALGEILTTRDRVAFKGALMRWLQAAKVDRTEIDLATARAAIAAKNAAKADALAATFEEHAGRYARLLAAERAVIQNLGEVGARAIEVRFPVDASQRVTYEEAAASSLPQARARAANALFDALVAQAGDLGPYPEQSVAYALLALTSASRVDLRLDIDMDLSDSWAQSLEQYRAAGWQNLDRYTAGSSVARIDGGLFDIDAILRQE